MSRNKQIQIIDRAIHAIDSIAKGQCSLSDDDLNVLNEAFFRLRSLKQKKGKTNEQIRNEIAKVVVLLNKFWFKRN